MASDLDKELNEILGETAEVEETPDESSEAGTEEKNEGEGVETAEPEQEAQSEESEGEEPTDEELEKELKNIDPELREAILSASPELRESQIKVFKKMRAGIDRKHTELGEAKKLAETTKELFKQYGLDEKTGFNQIKNLVEFEKKLKEDPKAVIKHLQEMFKLNDEQSGSEQEIDLDSLTDNERILYNKIKKAEEEAEKAKKENENFRRLTEKEQQDLVVKEINQFRSAVNEDGSLTNPYFDDLLPEMERLSGIYPNDNVEKLYNKALRLNDEIYQKSLDDKRAKENAFLTKKQEEALKRAKSINSQSLKHKSSSSPQAKSLDDILGDILDGA